MTDEHPISELVKKLAYGTKFSVAARGRKGDVEAYTREEYVELLNEMKRWRREARRLLEENEQLRQLLQLEEDS